MEIWKSIPGFDGQYFASDMGRIKSAARVVTKVHRNGKVMRQSYNERILSCKKADKLGHRSTTLTGVNGEQTLFVHRLVLLTFVGPCPEGMEACHRNGKASDNTLSNLRWGTHLSNNRDRKEHGMYAVGEKHVMAKLSAKDVRDIRMRISDGESNNSIAADYPVISKTIWSIRIGNTWSQV